MDYIHEYNVDPFKRDIYLVGEEDYPRHFEGGEPGVEYMMANRFIKNIRILASVSNDPILIHMKTCGGDWAEGMAIYDAIKACPCYVVILSYTHARSMSSLIFQAADHRVMMPYSTFMFHDGTMATDGTVKQYFTEAEELKRSRDQMMEIYLDRAVDSEYFEGRSRAQVKRWMRDKMDRKEEVYLDAETAVSMNFADEVFGLDGKYDWNALRNHRKS
jgi:ATP-dependent protease ClpP protease subunit